MISSGSGKKFMSELPFKIQEEIIFFLYNDFLVYYRSYLRALPPNQKTKISLLYSRLTQGSD